ncbi:MAG: hypothetical protein ABWZ79_21805 [Pedobacter agri]
MTSGLEPGLLSQPNKIEAAERQFSSYYETVGARISSNRSRKA